jgi:hypothetical protein
MLGGAALVPAGFSDQQTPGAASSAVEVLPFASRECVSRLGEAFEHGLDPHMTIGLRCPVKRFNPLVEQARPRAGRAPSLNLEVP